MVRHRMFTRSLEEEAVAEAGRIGSDAPWNGFTDATFLENILYVGERGPDFFCCNNNFGI